MNVVRARKKSGKCLREPVKLMKNSNLTKESEIAVVNSRNQLYVNMRVTSAFHGSGRGQKKRMIK